MDDVLSTDAARRALVAHDIAAVFRLLMEAGVSQRHIAERTGQSQSEVSEILKGRRVMAYDVLARIAEGLGVPREWMGLAYTGGEDELGGYAGSTDAEELDEDVIRRTERTRNSLPLLPIPTCWRAGRPSMPGTWIKAGLTSTGH